MIDYKYTEIGKNFRVKEPVNIGGYGFNLTRNSDGSWMENPHGFKVVIGDDVSIGAFNNIDRGIWRDTILSDGVKTDAHVHVGHNAFIGKHVTLGQKCTIGGSCDIGDYSQIWIGSFIHQHVKVGKNCMVGAMTYLRHDLPDDHAAYGNPVIVKHRSELKYPWIKYE